ncbi:MFS transporter [Paenibacillus silvisoli]|uniref:MFS transporter n=1 Tax=Paenibacillus silvisoli TaxID=3110539 RepID=UPI0028054B82|nr:MFS transporter [Paenibacillus silvisoli]
MEKSRLIVYIVVCFIASVHLGVVIPLFSFISHDLKLSAALAGFVAAMLPLGGLTVNFFSERIVRRIGFQRTMLLGILLQIALLLALIAAPYSIALWVVVRYLLGVSFSLIFMPPQVSIGVELKAKKAFFVSVLGVVFGLGLTVGPLLTNLKAIDVRLPLIAVSVLYVGILAAVSRIRNTFLPASEPHAGSVSRLRILKQIWVAMLPAILFGFCEICLTAIFPMEARDRGFSEAQASLIISLFPLSALAGQVPAAMLSDRFGPRKVAPYLYAGAAAAFVLPFIYYSFVSLLAASLMCGLMIGHGYYFTVSYVNALTDKETVVRANILIEAAYNLFTVFVPLAVGFYLQLAGGATTVFIPLLAIAAMALATHFVSQFRFRY